MFLNNKQKVELRASKIYIKNLNNLSDELFVLPEESNSVDIIYKPQNLKFQVTCFDGGCDQLNKYKKFDDSHELNKIVDQFILEPINKKTIKYGGTGVSDIILLLHYIHSPWTKEAFKKEIKEREPEINEISKKSGFKSIYLVFDIDDSIIKIY